MTAQQNFCGVEPSLPEQHARSPREGLAHPAANDRGQCWPGRPLERPVARGTVAGSAEII
jgi:hypothetical protein